MKAEAVLALDFGTGSAKAALYSRAGERLAFASRDYPVARPHTDWAEQSPADYLDAARELCAALGSRTRVAAVGLSTQTPTLVFLDGRARPVGPAIVWQDARAGEESRHLVDHHGAAERREWFGMDLPIGPTATPAKLLWMARRQPRRWRAVRWVVQPKDYVARELTGELATDPWCAKGVVHLATGEPHPGYSRLLGKNGPLSPAPRPPDEIAGLVTPDAAARFGLPAGTPVTVGWSDALAGILATGALRGPGRGFVLSGTSEIIGVSARPRRPARGLFWVPPRVLGTKGVGLHYGPTQAGGSALDWLARLTTRTPADLLALLPERGLSDIVFRPYLQGERAPFWDNTLTASFTGLRAEHGLGDLAAAALQGVALQERLVLELAQGRAPCRVVALAGGAARDPRWNRLRADVLQRRVVALQDAEASLRGAALLAWHAAGAFDRRRPPEGWFAGEAVLPDRRLAEKARELLTLFTAGQGRARAR